MDFLVTRKVAVLFCNHTYPDKVVDMNGDPVGHIEDAQQKTALMDRFLRETLGFDIVKRYVNVDLDGLHTAMNELDAIEVEPWLADVDRKGTLLIFVYFMGYWGKTSGSQVFSVTGEKINLDQRLMKFSARDHSIYGI